MNPAAVKGRNTEIFGDGYPFGDPSWYQAYNSPYYNDSHRSLRKHFRDFIEEHIMGNVHEWGSWGNTERSLFEGRRVWSAVTLHRSPVA